MIRDYNVNQFKFDGTGNADRVFPGSAFDSDFGAAIQLIEDLRRQKQDLFLNVTTGTTASPFWLFYADSIWRGGETTTSPASAPTASSFRFLTASGSRAHRRLRVCSSCAANSFFPSDSAFL